jgi:glycosyltransferase involved in cell wall biosynthesis
MHKPLVVALITPDLRDDRRQYSEPQPVFGYAPTALLQGLGSNPECEVHIVSCVQRPVASPEKVSKNTFYHSVKVGKWGWLRGAYAGSIVAVRRKLRQIKPDIVHGQGTERYCALCAVFSGFPNVITIHGNMRMIARSLRARPFTFHWLAARLESVALWKAGGVFCNSAYTESLVAPWARKIWRVSNCLRTEFFSPAPSSARAARPILLNVGVVSAYKRQTEILAVARRLWQRGLRFEMQFAGAVDAGTSYGAQFMRQLAEAEAAGYARHVGVLETSKLIAALDAASALVHFPSEESFGLVVAEALARNLKLFAASVGGVVDIAAGVEGAELLPMNDWTALEDSIARWLESGCPRPATAAAVMRRRYHPEIIAGQHLEIYREVINTRTVTVSG